MTEEEKRDLIKRHNEEALERFETRPIVDQRAWYKQEYARNGMTWPGPEPDPDSPKTYEEEYSRW